MSRHVRVALLLATVMLICLRVARPAHRQVAPQTPPQMVSYYLVLLKQGSKFNEPRTEEQAADLQRRHIAHLQTLGREGYGIVAGPVEDHADGSLRGILVLKAESLEKARELAGRDPAVQSGRLALEFHTWWVEKGTLREPAPNK